MAFDKTPATSTYQTKQIPLLSEINSRAASVDTDVDYLNCYPELIKNKTTQEQKMSIRKRKGCSAVVTMPNTVTRGCYYWEDQSKLYVAQSDDVLVYNMPAGTLATTLNTVFPTTTTGDVGFTEFLYETGEIKLVVTDGTTLSTIDSANTVVASADPDLPAHVPQPVFLDGYLFIVKTNTADLYNSDLNDPLAYTSGDFISSELLADKVTNIIRLNNYILLFGTDSIEYFWDAANETGSPLQRNDTPVKLVGFSGGLAQLGNKVYFIGDNDHSESNVMVLEDFKIAPVGNEPVKRFLTSSASSTKYANIVAIDGHDFYVLYTNGRTYVMDLETPFWTRWGFGSTAYFDMHFALNCRTSTSYTPVFIRVGNAVLYKFDMSLYRDAGTAITATLTTDNTEFDTRNKKFMSKLVLNADKPTATSEVLVQWSDDDYQTWNTGTTVDLNQEHPSLSRLGGFRRRAFKLTHTANQPMRINSLEADINMGRA